MNSSDKNHPNDEIHSKKEDQQEKEIENGFAHEYRTFEPDSDFEINELKQEEKISEQITAEYQSKQSQTKKKFVTITLVAIAVSFVLAGTFVILNVENSKNVSSDDSLTSQFVIQNLRGDSIDTWISWKIVEGDLFHVHVVDSPFVTEERLDAIFDVIMSSKEVVIDDSLLNKGPKGHSSTYYLGWYGGLNSINENTSSPIPKNLHFHVTDQGEGHILIELTNLSNPDGYSGFTKSIVDESSHQILKATITIYDIEKLSIEQLKTIIRHELGHGFGLAHSTAPEDLMYPTISTAYPYISSCALDAVKSLYDGGETSQVICEK